MSSYQTIYFIYALWQYVRFCTGAVYSQYPSKKKTRRPIKHPFIPDKEENVTTREVTNRSCLLLIVCFTQSSTRILLICFSNPVRTSQKNYATFLFSYCDRRKQITIWSRPREVLAHPKNFCPSFLYLQYCAAFSWYAFTHIVRDLFCGNSVVFSCSGCVTTVFQKWS